MIDQAPEALVIPLSNSPGQGWKQHYPERHPDQADGTCRAVKATV